MGYREIKAIGGAALIIATGACSKDGQAQSPIDTSNSVVPSTIEVPTTINDKAGIDFRIKCNDGTQVTIRNNPSEISLDKVPFGSDSVSFQDPNAKAQYSAIIGSLGTLEENSTSKGFVIPRDMSVSDYAMSLQMVQAYPDETVTDIIFYNYSNGEGLSETFEAISKPNPAIPGAAMKATDTKIEIRDFDSGQGRELQMLSVSDETGELGVEAIGDETNPLRKSHVVNGKDGSLKVLECDYFRLELALNSGPTLS